MSLQKRAERLKKEGRDVLNLSLGEPVWETFPSVREEAKKALDEGWTKYTPSAGLMELRESAAGKASKDFGWTVDPGHVIAAAGCKQALFTLFQCLCEAGDEVILPTPCWLSYQSIISLSGAKARPVACNEETGFKITPSLLEEACGKAKILLLNSPNNPTGAVYSEEELKGLGDVLRAYKDVLIITDDIYERLVFGRERAPHILQTCPDLRERVFCVNGVSKSFLMTGWRLGWIIAPGPAVRALSAFQSQSISCANAMAQRAVSRRLLNCDADIRNLKRKLLHLRDKFLTVFKSISHVKTYCPEGGFYLWIDVKKLEGARFQRHTIRSSKDLMELLMREALILCLSGESFQAPGYLRFSYGVSEEDLEKASQRIKTFFQKITL